MNMRVSPRPLRTTALAASLLACGLAVAGCAALAKAERTNSAVERAGYQDVSVSVLHSSSVPGGERVSVLYSSGPTGDETRDARQAEKIVWDTFADHFGQVVIVLRSGGCTGPVCVTHSTELARASYAQLAAAFGPRPADLK